MLSVLRRILGIFTSPAAEKAIEKIADYVPVALPYVTTAAEIVAGMTPTQVDDLALGAIKAKFPQLFNGSLKTGDEVKLFTLGVATELLNHKYPQLSTSVARASAQLAYVGQQADKAA